MNATATTTRLLAAAAFALLAATGTAHAEDYQGVQQTSAQRSRADVAAEAVAAAHAANQNVTRGSRGTDNFKSSADRGDVRAAATLAVRTGKLTAYGEVGTL
ncbi:helicase SNF2 [Variovorax sp. J22G21]|uniref:helicase SNF2 n=1 Tax=Variovorax fucosicus TaxID=3053517 RepID=UPI002578F034|nr:MULTISPECIES: helicase SNF2 [unclassified Variovorax]MDM0040639.1 helicase SNF2 [Variovorax sp. J22R193]MDM0058757.1 helicase SNF2 [Variovorax sp. J22G47]MDM0062012.1 helicase SNF2 [Variovorax sp. J22G21]